MSTRSGKKRFPLDNAGLGFSLITNPQITTVYRLSATLTDIIDPERMQNALESTLEALPYFRVCLKSGFLWPYWETNPAATYVEDEVEFPNQYIPITQRNQFPFRVIVSGNTLAVEIHHTLTDGFGGIAFLKALLMEYLAPVRSRHPQIREEDYEDAYLRYYNPDIPGVPLFARRAFLLPHKREPTGVYHATTATAPLDVILGKAREFGVTLTAFIVALYLEALTEIQKQLAGEGIIKRQRPVRIMVPVDLRKLFPSQTKRNFTLYVTPGVDPQARYGSFDELANEINLYLKSEVNRVTFARQLSRYIGSRRNPLLGHTPLAVKKLFSGLVYYYLGSSFHSGMFTNVGEVRLPRVLKDEVEKIRLIPAPLAINKVGAGMLSYNGELSITFGRLISDPLVERRVFSKLVSHGVDLSIQTG